MAPNSPWVNLEVKGMKELEAKLLKLPRKIAQRILYRAVLAGAGVVRKEAKRLVVKRTGSLEKAIRAKRVRTKKPGLAIYQVGARHPVAHLIEFGVAPHTIKAKRKKVMSDGSTFYGKTVKHPGFSAKPFLRPAFDQSAQKVLQAMNKKLMKDIEKEAPHLFGKVGK